MNKNKPNKISFTHVEFVIQLATIVVPIYAKNPSVLRLKKFTLQIKYLIILNLGLSALLGFYHEFHYFHKPQ